MPNFIRALIIYAIACSTIGAGADACANLKSLAWLLGDWEQVNDSTVTRESWQQVSENTFEGTGETLAVGSGKRRGSEALRLVSMQDAVFYLAKVGGNARPVAFALTSCAIGRATFENPEHDFPRKLEYSLTKDDQLNVAVSDGAGSGFEIDFVRRKPTQGETTDE